MDMSDLLRELVRDYLDEQEATEGNPSRALQTAD
jgi:hypothetical protein